MKSEITILWLKSEDLKILKTKFVFTDKSFNQTHKTGIRSPNLICKKNNSFPTPKLKIPVSSNAPNCNSSNSCSLKILILPRYHFQSIHFSQHSFHQLQFSSSQSVLFQPSVFLARPPTSLIIINSPVRLPAILIIISFSSSSSYNFNN